MTRGADPSTVVNEPRSHRRSLLRRRTAVVSAAVAVVLVAVAVAYAWTSSDQKVPAAASGPQASASGIEQPSASASAGVSPTPGQTAASPSRSATAKPTTSAPTAPRAGGKPGAANTGVPAGTKLTVVTGNQSYSTPNQVISGLDIHGFVSIRAKNVTIKNSIIRGGSNPECVTPLVWVKEENSASLTIQDSEFVASNPSPCIDGIWATNATLIRLNIHGVVDGVKAFDDVTLQDSYVHDLSWFASDPTQGGGPTHNDAVQSFEGDQRVTLKHNTLSPGSKGNAAYQVTQDGGKQAKDLRIDGNWLDGGGCTLNFAHKGGPTPMTGIYVTNNRFGRGSSFNCPILVSTQTVLSQNSGNVWDDTGKAIPAPEQHD
jgi:hypothetical protein